MTDSCKSIDKNENNEQQSKTSDDVRIPSQSEKRIRSLIELFKKQKKIVALFVDEAHDLHTKTLVSLKRLMEVVEDGGGLLSIVLAGHVKLKNDLIKPSLEEIGSRTAISELDDIGFTGIRNSGQQMRIPRMVVGRVLQTRNENRLDNNRRGCRSDGGSFDDSPSNRTLHYVGIKPVSEEVVESVISKSINDLEPRKNRYGYNTKTLSYALNIKPSVVKSFFHGQLSPNQTHEIQNEILALRILL